MCSYLDVLLHKDFSQAASSSKSSSRQYSRTTKPNNSTKHCGIQKDSVHCTVVAVITLVFCYLPLILVTPLVIQGPARGELSSATFLAVQFTTTLVYFNSSSNPILYCWKITEVRQAAKNTITKLFCSSS